MDAQRPGRPLVPLSPLRLGLVVVAVVVLAVLAAAASRPGDAPAAPPASPATSAAVIRALAILAVAGEVALFALLFFVRAPRMAGAARSKRRPLATVLVAVIQLLAVVLVYELYRRSHHLGAQLLGGGGIPALVRVPHPGTVPPAGGQEWLTALIVLGVLAVVALVLVRRLHRRSRSPLGRLAGRLREAVDEGLEGLEAEPDPRRAVITAYARMERALARGGMPRETQETPLEYLGRLLLLLDAESAPARKLTELFHLARFSEHPIDEEMKRDAIAALTAIRASLDLREAAARTRPGLAGA